MGINIRTKGAEGEREVIRALEPIARRVLAELGHVVSDGAVVQRNQNQTAVGGCDLTGTFGLAIEVKRQEQLAVGTWWKQACKSAADLGEQPVLVYRQNRQRWRVMMNGYLALPNSYVGFPVEVTWEDFLAWFEVWVRRYVGHAAP